MQYYSVYDTYTCIFFYIYHLTISWLKADRPHPRDNSTHRQTRWTDNESSLLFAALGKAAPLISTAARQKVDLDLWPWPWPWPRPLTLTLKQGNLSANHDFLLFDLDLWPTTLTYNPSLASIKVDPYTRNEGQMSNGSASRAWTNTPTNTQTDGQTLPSALSSCFAKATRSIITVKGQTVQEDATKEATDTTKSIIYGSLVVQIQRSLQTSLRRSLRRSSPKWSVKWSPKCHFGPTPKKCTSEITSEITS